MISTKQFTIFFLLVVIFLAAISIVTSLAWREAEGGLYDTVLIRNTIIAIINVAAEKIVGQEAAMQMWVDEVEAELLLAQAEIDFFMTTSNTVIHNAFPPPPTP